jgi:hypothetical protein
LVELDDNDARHDADESASTRARRLGGPLVGAVALVAEILGLVVLIGDDVFASDLDRTLAEQTRVLPTIARSSWCPVLPVG